jgi:outer membrane protein TolC
VATADLYPKLSLTGSIGLEAMSAGSLIKADNCIYQLGPTLQWRIFDAGRIRQNIKIEDAITEQKLLAYQSAVHKGLGGGWSLAGTGSATVRREAALS